MAIQARLMAVTSSPRLSAMLEKGSGEGLTAAKLRFCPVRGEGDGTAEYGRYQLHLGGEL